MSEKVTSADCVIFREKAREEGTTIAEIADMFNQPWAKVHRHVAGDCDHDISTEPVDDIEALERFTVAVSDCAELRSSAQAAESILDLSDDVVWNYHTVLRHIRGRCDHNEVPVDAIPVEDVRSENVTEEKCEQIRNAYFDERLSITDAADKFSFSATTAERHIQFKCSHKEK